MQEKEYAKQQLQQLLKKIFKDPAERARILRHTSLDNSTVNRWLNGETQPRAASLKLILEYCPPDDQKALAELIELTAKEAPTPSSLAGPAIPSTFYARVLLTLAETPHSLRFSAIGHLVLQQAIQQLDPLRTGMDITILRCVHASTGIRCLQESLRLQKTSQTSLNYFFGIESLAGYAVSSFQIAYNKHGIYYTLTQEEVDDATAIAVPILRAGCIGGCLLIEAPLPRGFTPEELSVIKDYALVIALAFDPRYFFEKSEIDFIIVPPKKAQMKLLLSMHERKIALMRSKGIDSSEADFLVTQQIIADLANLAYDS